MKNIVVEITSDDVPELEAAYRLKIVSVDGGADINPARNNLTFIIRYTSDALSGACMGPREIDGQCRLKFPSQTQWFRSTKGIAIILAINLVDGTSTTSWYS